MPTRKRKLTDEEKSERARLQRLMEAQDDEIEEEIEVEEEDGEEILVIRGNAARTLIARLGLDDEEDDKEDDETPPKDKRKGQDKPDDDEPDGDEPDGDEPPPDKTPKSGHRYFR